MSVVLWCLPFMLRHRSVSPCSCQHYIGRREHDVQAKKTQLGALTPDLAGGSYRLCCEAL